MNKSLLLYPLILIVFGLGMYIAVEQGSTLDASRNTHHAPRTTPPAMQPSSGVGPSASLLANLRQNFQDPLTRLFVQLILIVLAARVCGGLMRKAGQPAVIGEMIAGILLGPSLARLALARLLPNGLSRRPPSAPCGCSARLASACSCSSSGWSWTSPN